MFFGHEYPKETETKVQEWIIDKSYVEEKKNFLYNYWSEIEPEIKDSVHISLEKVKAKAGIKQNTKQFILRKRLIRVAAVILPLILLSGGYLYFNGPFADHSLLKISVAYGQKQEIVLPDGTRVWINAGTTVQYPEKFAGNNRIIKLSGEAYFDVKKDESHPFIVETRKLSVKVLGTEFNVSAYPDDEQTITTLNSGKIEIETSQKETYVLEPDQQLALNNHTKKVVIESVVSSDYSDWKSDRLIFDNVTLNEIIKILERKFNISFKVDKDIENKRYTLKFSEKDSLEQILEVLTGVSDFTYEKQDNTVWLKPRKR